MSAPRLSLVMGDTRGDEGSEAVGLPLSGTGTVHIHLHVGEAEAPNAAVKSAPNRGWVGLFAGVVVTAAFIGGYQVGHRPTRDTVSNLQPIPPLAGFVSPEVPVMPELPAMPPPSGMPAIERQLATPPVIVAPPPVLRQVPVQADVRPVIPTVPTSPAPAAPDKPGMPSPSRNAFGLEN